MSENDALLALIGNTYDAALDPSLWIKVLDDSAKFVGGPAAALFYKDASSRSGGAAYDVGIEPHYRQTYFDHYIKLDPLTTSQFFAEVDEPVSTSDLVPYGEFLESRFYREWAYPQGLVDFATCVLDKSTAGASMFGVFRHERDGIVDEGTRRRMRLLSPHVRRAMMIGRVIDVKEREAGAIADALDGLAAAMFLLAANGRIAHANKAGHAMLATAEVLGCSRGQLVATDRMSNEMLQDVFVSADKGDGSLGAKGVSVTLTASCGATYVAHALPMTSGARRRAAASSSATVALFVHSATLNIAAPPEALAKAFKLTPSELRVLLAVVEVGGVPEVAETLGIAANTVKTHLHRVFGKTGTSRQADLVKVVAGYVSPLVA